MIVILHRSFDKDYKKLPDKVKIQFKIRKNLFLEDQSHFLLHDHEIQGKYIGCRSINITSDYRAIYYSNNDIIIFIRIGTHPQLYGK